MLAKQNFLISRGQWETVAKAYSNLFWTSGVSLGARDPWQDGNTPEDMPIALTADRQLKVSFCQVGKPTPLCRMAMSWEEHAAYVAKHNLTLMENPCQRSKPQPMDF